MENRNNNNHGRKNEVGMFGPLFSSFFDYPAFREDSHSVMKTDIAEHNDRYDFNIEVPGIKKEDVSINLEDGYLTIQASRKHEETENDKRGRLIRQERAYGTYSRSFYVGEDVKDTDISASMNNGLLEISVKKPVEEKPIKKSIEIK